MSVRKGKDHSHSSMISLQMTHYWRKFLKLKPSITFSREPTVCSEELAVWSLVLACLSWKLLYRGAIFAWLMKPYFITTGFHTVLYLLAPFTLSKKSIPTFSSNLEQVPLSRSDTLWPISWSWSAELSQLHQLFKPHQLKTGKLFYFSREDITVSNTITQNKFTSGNQHVVVFAEAFLIPYLISLWVPIKLIY